MLVALAEVEAKVYEAVVEVRLQVREDVHANDETVL
jgi:hypothetical protein